MANEKPKFPPLDPELAKAAHQAIEDYEYGDLTYDQAHSRVVELARGHPALYFIEVELFFASVLLEDKWKSKDAQNS